MIDLANFSWTSHCIISLRESQFFGGICLGIMRLMFFHNLSNPIHHVMCSLHVFFMEMRKNGRASLGT